MPGSTDKVDVGLKRLLKSSKRLLGKSHGTVQNRDTVQTPNTVQDHVTVARDYVTIQDDNDSQGQNNVNKYVGENHEDTDGSQQDRVQHPAELNQLAFREMSLPGFAEEQEVVVKGEEKGNCQGCLPDPNWINLEEVRQWIETCDLEHGEECHHPSLIGTERPVWLIDVEQACLVPAEEHRYIALSYVWGGVESSQATTDNIELLQLPGILEEEEAQVLVPKTIRHAMVLTKLLGEKHLWVDRFCICQDDIETKHAQIQSMASTYGNAYLTIVAANEWDANHGLRGLKGVTKPRGVSQYLTTQQYFELMDLNNTIWNTRDLSYPEDGLRAYLGVIQQFSNIFPAGFLWGLPVSEFHAALLWQPIDTLKRRRARGKGADALELPSWSWVGWQGGIDAKICASYKSQGLKPLCVWEAMGNSRVTPSPPTNQRLEGNTQAIIHESRFLYTRAPVARAWFGDQGTSEESTALVQMTLKQDESPLRLVYICSSPDRDNRKAACGALGLSPGLRDDSHAGEQCWLLAISTGNWSRDAAQEAFAEHNSRRERNGWWRRIDFVRDLRFNYVIWIWREDGVAYRKGLGVILVDDWETLDPKMEEIVLG
ncbi:hypothetical protein PG985_011948 [Apiospora marii]|uniref:uncharacterized protein n=1 Tax=Apiospora marii TaxID=335849 RepID=UPI0031300C41